MKKILIKFSDERSRKFSICTEIEEDEITKERWVSKKAIYSEGKAHLEDIVSYFGLLKKTYPNVKICPVRKEGEDCLHFDYIQGKSLEDKYRECVIRNDKARMKELLKLHVELVIGTEENICDFVPTAQCESVFGIKEWDGKALRVVNFDATAGNIIFEKEVPVFIDYEWVYDFPVPLDLAVYHCVRDSYLHVKELEQFYPLAEAMRDVAVEADIEILEKAYEIFYANVIKDENGFSFGLSKKLNLKGFYKTDEQELLALRESLAFAKQNWEQTSRAFEEAEKERQRLIDACAFAEKSWKEACQANATLSQQIPRAREEAEVWKQKYEQEVLNHQIHAKQIEDAVQEQARQSETWRVAYETVINSRTWRWSKKLKRLIGKK